MFDHNKLDKIQNDNTCHKVEVANIDDKLGKIQLRWSYET